jgi:signal recognition particle receptor subunit beta
MVFFNYATMQMAAKIVYYGPGLCGKTTNLHHIYAKTSPQSRGEMVSLETETDRTLFFDLLPIDVGVIGGFKTRLQLYTIPGQVFYNTTRKLVLKGVDGIVFVADSQLATQEANVDSLRNLRENLAEIGLDLDDIPTVIQLNKRDLPSVASVESMVELLDPERKHEHIESVAATGVGVFETLKLISKLTLRTLRRRMTGDEPVRTTSAPRVIAGVSPLRAKDSSPESRTTVTGTAVPAVGTPAPPPTPAFSSPAAAASVASAATSGKAQVAHEEVEEIEPSEEITSAPFSDQTLAKTADVDSRIISDAPVAESRQTSPHAPVVPPDPPAEPEINFSQTKTPSKTAEVKHVKVRTSVDIMAELESLRKRATATGTPKPVKKEISPLDALMGRKPAPAPAPAPPPVAKKDLQKSVALKVPAEALAQTKSLKLTVSFEGSDGVIQTQEKSIDLPDARDAKSVSINLKVDVGD